MPAKALPPAPPAASDAVRSVMRGNRGQNTAPEIAVRSELHRRGYRYRIHTTPEPGLRCRADIVFPRERIAVFIDGCYWHGCAVHGRIPDQNRTYWAKKLELNCARDRRNNAVLRAAGWAVIRAWEHEAPSDVADRVASALQARRGQRAAIS